MNIKLIDIVKTDSILKKILASDTKSEIGFRCARLLKKLISEIQTYKETKDRIIKKHGTEVKDKPGYYNFSDESGKLAMEDLKNLDDTQIEVDDGLRINASLLNDAKLTYGEILDMSEFLFLDTDVK